MQEKHFTIEITSTNKESFEKYVSKIKEISPEYGEIQRETYSNGDARFTYFGVVFSAKMNIKVGENINAYDFFKRAETEREKPGLENIYIKIEYFAFEDQGLCCGYKQNSKEIDNNQAI